MRTEWLLTKSEGKTHFIREVMSTSWNRLIWFSRVQREGRGSSWGLRWELMCTPPKSLLPIICICNDGWLSRESYPGPPRWGQHPAMN